MISSLLCFPFHSASRGTIELSNQHLNLLKLFLLKTKQNKILPLYLNALITDPLSFYSQQNVLKERTPCSYPNPHPSLTLQPSVICLFQWPTLRKATSYSLLSKSNHSWQHFSLFLAAMIPQILVFVCLLVLFCLVLFSCVVSFVLFSVQSGFSVSSVTSPCLYILWCLPPGAPQILLVLWIQAMPLYVLFYTLCYSSKTSTLIYLLMTAKVYNFISHGSADLKKHLLIHSKNSLSAQHVKQLATC